MTCTFATTPEMTCHSTDVVVRLDGDLLCADHLHQLHPVEVESGHADSIPGVTFLY